MMTRLFLGVCVLTFGLALGLTGCDGVSTSPDEISREDSTKAANEFRPTPKDPSDIDSSLKQVASGGTLTIPVEAVADSPSTPRGGGPLEFESASVSDGALAKVEFQQNDSTEALLSADSSTAGNTIEMSFRPAYGDFVSTEAGSLSVTIQKANQAPEASYTFSPQSPEVGEEVSFDASGSSDDGTIGSYEWDFNNDGIFEASGQTATNTFESSGEKQVTLRVTDNDAVTDDTTRTVTVQKANQAPEASYTFSPQSPEVGEEVSFDASGSSDDGTIGSYEWDFNNDGIFEASGQTATNTFESSGVKQVTLRVTDNDAVTDDTTRTVDVGPRAVNDTLDTGENEKLSVDSPGVLENDKGRNLSVSAVAGKPENVGDKTELSSGALLTLMQSGGFTYDPNGAFNFLTGDQDSTDTFTYQASVDNGSDQADVTVMIKGANDPPEIDTLAGLTVDSADTATITTDSLSASDPDDPPSKLTYEVKEDPENGRLVKNQTSGVEEFKQENLINEEVRYIHDGSVGNTDNDSFKFELSDDDGDGPDVMTFEIVVKSEGDG